MSVGLYIGGPRCGKSTLLRRHIYGTRQPGVRFLIMDRDGRATWDGPVFAHVEAFRSSPMVARFSIFRGPTGAEVAALAIELGSSVYVDEEAHRVLAEGYGPARLGRAAHPLYRIAHEGAHLANADGDSTEVMALLATHRPQNLPADLVACAEHVYLGRTTLFADVERCYREGWVAKATSSRDAGRILGSLQPGQFLTTTLRF